MKYSLFFIFAFVGSFGYTQDTISSFSRFFKTREYAFQLNSGVGFMGIHRPDMAHIPVQRAHDLGFTLLIHTKGQKSWQNDYKKPSFGIGFHHSGLSNDQIMGKANYLDAHIELPFIHTASFSFYWKYSLGIAYISKAFDQKNNPKNIAIGSAINASSNTGIGIRKQFKSFEISSSFELNHYSNGATVLPNLGTNYIMLKFGVSKRIVPKISNQILSNDYTKSWRFSGILMGSTKQYFPTGGRNYPIIGLISMATRQFGKRAGIEFTFDIIANNASFAYKTELKKKQKDVIQLGLYCGYVLPVDKLHFMLGFGYYVRDKIEPIGKVYTRFGLRYYVNDTWILNFAVKSNWGRADYIEYGIGYSILKQKKR
jgi:Lipid A 3-O-deacylase (PagL)